MNRPFDFNKVLMYSICIKKRGFMKTLIILSTLFLLTACGGYSDENGNPYPVYTQTECQIQYAALLDKVKEVSIGDHQDKVVDILGYPDSSSSYKDYYEAWAYDYTQGRYVLCDQIAIIYTRNDHIVRWIDYNSNDY